MNSFLEDFKKAKKEAEYMEECKNEELNKKKQLEIEIAGLSDKEAALYTSIKGIVLEKAITEFYVMRQRRVDEWKTETGFFKKTAILHKELNECVGGFYNEDWVLYSNNYSRPFVQEKFATDIRLNEIVNRLVSLGMKSEFINPDKYKITISVD